MNSALLRAAQPACPSISGRPCARWARACSLTCRGAWLQRSAMPSARGLSARPRFLGSGPELLPGSASVMPCHAPPRRGALHVAAAGTELSALGTDFLLFLGATVLVIPTFKAAKQSPILGYLFAGFMLGQLGLFRDVEALEKLSELGVLFLLFEMGLELSFDKLRALAKYAFGLGTVQMVACSLAFMAVSLPPGQGLMSQFLEVGLHAPPSLVGIRTADEAIVIAVALSLSSSAFVLQLLKERGELETRFGQATLGILLFQDIATVPFLVLLPLIEGGGAEGLDGSAGTATLLAKLGPTILSTVGALGLVLLGGRTVIRRVFGMVAAARSDDTFIALCLLTVTGAAVLTQRLGFSDTLGAFVAGVLLAETNFRTQVEADIQPFRGILLGLFFVKTGSSLDVALLIRQWPIVLTLLFGLLGLKTTLITLAAERFGLTRAEAVRVGFGLSQGGEFAFVLLALASQLAVLPEDLNRLLIIVVVLSMAATPALAAAGTRVADWINANEGEALGSVEGYNMGTAADRPVLIAGFGDVGQAVANMLLGSAAAAGTLVPFVGFDLTVDRVQAAQRAGFNVLYGDGSRPKVLHAAGVGTPRAIAVCYTARQRAVAAVGSLREAYPDVPIYVRAVDLRHAAELEMAGATTVVTSETEAGLELGSRLFRDIGVAQERVDLLAGALRTGMDARLHEIEGLLEEKKAQPGQAGPGASNSAVWRFDQSQIDWSLVPSPGLASGAGTVSDAEDGEGPGLGSALLSRVLEVVGGGTTSSSNVGGSGTFTATSSVSSGSSVDFVDADELLGKRPAASRSESATAVSGNDRTALQTLRTGEMVTVPDVPDGSVECPVDWSAMSDEEDGPASNGRPPRGSIG